MREHDLFESVSVRGELSHVFVRFSISSTPFVSVPAVSAIRRHSSATPSVFPTGSVRISFSAPPANKASNSVVTCWRWRFSTYKSAGQSVRFMAWAIRSRSSSLTGNNCVCWSSRYCRRCSRLRKNVYADCSASTRASVMMPSEPSCPSAARVEHVCSVGSRPPRIN